MNSPLDAKAKNEVAVEMADSQSRQISMEFSNTTTAPKQSNRLPDEAETMGRKQTAENFVVPSLEAICVPSKEKETVIAECDLLKDMLVVDDLPVNRKLIGIQLKKLGCSVDEAENGQRAIEMIQNKEYAIVFMDLDMPVLEGYQAAIAIRQWDLENRQHTPVIGMSSSKKEIERQKCVTSGMNDYISKGANSKVLEGLMLRFPRKKTPPVVVEKEIENKDGLEITWNVDKYGERIGFITTELLSEKKLVRKVYGDDLPFGGTWTFELSDINGTQTQLVLTENGFVKPPIFRALAHLVFGTRSTMESFVNALKKRIEK